MNILDHFQTEIERMNKKANITIEPNRLIEILSEEATLLKTTPQTEKTYEERLSKILMVALMITNYAGLRSTDIINDRINWGFEYPKKIFE